MLAVEESTRHPSRLFLRRVPGHNIFKNDVSAATSLRAGLCPGSLDSFRHGLARLRRQYRPFEPLLHFQLLGGADRLAVFAPGPSTRQQAKAGVTTGPDSTASEEPPPACLRLCPRHRRNSWLLRP